MKRRALLALPLLVLCPDVTLAATGEITINWTHPLADGVPLPQSQINHFLMQAGYPNRKGGFGIALLNQRVAATGRSVTFVALPPGKYCFRGFVVTTSLEQGKSNVISAVVA
jgi:hypothetical protein